MFDGLRVVEVATGMAGPLAGMVLADYGADVVKVESPNGDWARALPGFRLWNRGKRSVVIDLSTRAGQARLGELAVGADVVLDGMRPAVAERVGLGWDRLHAANPALIACSITGFGSTNPELENIRAYEATVAAATGRMTGIDRLSGGHPGRVYDDPAFTAAPIACFGAGMLAAQGIVAALIQREATGVGQRVTTSLVQGAMAFLMRQELSRDGDGADQAHAISAATNRGIELCFLTVECADGRYIQMCARQDQHFRNWLTGVGLGSLLDDPRYRHAPMGLASVAAGDELEVLVRERMRTRTREEWLRLFTEELDVGCDPFLTPAELLEHPDMLDNGRVVDIDDPDVGRLRTLGPLVTFAGETIHVGRLAPRQGVGAPTADERPRAPTPPRPSPEPTLSAESRPLAGVTVLEVAYYIAGPMATAMLAELGARVIKVEPLAGDPYRRTGLQSAKFLHGKESITLDLRSDEGKEVLGKLLARSDAVVHSFRGRAAERLGLDAASVLAIRPDIVYLYAASYGSRGPQADRAAFHSTPNALTGGGTKQAGLGNPPVNDSYPDPGSALGAATALLLGLFARRRGGQAQVMETTMLCSTAYIHGNDMVLYEGRPPWPVADADQRGFGPLYRLYRCADRWLFLAAPRAAEWPAVAAAVGGPQLVADTRFSSPVDRTANAHALTELLTAAFAGEPAADWVARLAKEDVSAVVVHDAPFDDWLVATGNVLPASHPAYPPYWRLPAKVQLSGSTPRLGPAAAVGEHSRAVLRELGYGDPVIDRLIAAGVTTDGRP